MAEGGNLPPERDVKDFKFQQLCRLRIGPSQSNLGLNYVQLVAASSKYGFAFIGFDKGVKVIQTAELSRIDQEHTKDRMTAIVEDYPVWSEIRLDGTISFVTLNSDEHSLAVVVSKNSVFTAYIYDVRAFANKGSSPLAFLTVMLTSSAGDTVTDMSWNPAQPSMLSVVLSSGKVTLYNITDSLEICASTPEAEAATCVCWSPKGKQLVVGTKDGKLKQFDQQLVKKREWACPDVLPTASYTIVGVAWLSTYSFLAAYITADSTDPTEQPLVVLTNGSKDKPPVYENFEDICFGNGEERQKRFSFRFLQNWDMVIATSSTACETGIIGKHGDQKDVWARWNLDDASRAEMPLTDDHVDTYPIGAAIDFSSQFQIPTGDSSVHPPSPLLLMLTTDGVLVPYYMMYSHKEAVPLTTPPQLLQAVGARAAKGHSGLQTDAARSPAPARTTPVSVGPTSGPSFQFVTPQSTGIPPSGPSFSFVASKPTGGNNTAATGIPGIASKPGATAFAGSSPGTPLFNFSTKPQAAFGTNPPASTQQTSVTTAAAAGYSFKTSMAPGAQFNFAAAGANLSQPVTSTASSGAPSSVPFSGFGQSSGFSAPSSTRSTGFAAPSSTPSSGFAAPSSTPSSGFAAPSSTPGSGFTAPSSTPSSGFTAPTSTSSSGFIAPTLTSSSGFVAPSSTPSSGFIAPSSSQSSGFAVQSATQSSGFALQSATQSSGFAVQSATQSSGFPGLSNKGQSLNLGTAASSGSPVFKLTTTENSAPTAASTPKPSPFNFAKSANSPAPTSLSVSQGPAPPVASAAAVGLGIQPRVGGTTIEQASKPTSAFVGFLTPQTSTPVTTPLAQTSNEFRGFLPPAPAAAIPRPTLQQPSVGGPQAGMFRATAPVSQSQPLLVRPVVTANQTLVSRPTATSASIPAGAPLVQPGGETNAGTISSSRSEASGASNATEVAGAGAADEDTYLKSILEEIAHFEKEMRDFRERTGGMDAVVGTKQEMLELKALSIDMDNFCTEVKATTKDQNKEVEDQKSTCLDLFAMTEECRSRNERNIDHQYHHLLKSRALDPASLDRLRQLQQQYQVVDQGIRNVDHILDQQWEEYQNNKKNKSRIKTPATDTLYRALKTNHNLILVQKDQLSTVERQLKELKLYKKSTWQTANTTRDSGRSNELLSLADSLLENTEDISPRNSTVLSVTVNPNKQARLRDHLTRRAVPRVKSTRPENLCMSKIVSTRRLQTSLVEPEPEIQPQMKPAENQPRPTVQATRGRKPATPSAVQAFGIGQPVQQAFRPPAQVNFPGQRVTTGFQQMPPVRQTMDSRFPGYGQTLATGQKNLGHIVVEDVTPPSSTGYDEDDDDDDEDDDDDDDDDDESDDNNGVGFGLQYSVDSQESELSGKGFDMSTPKAAGNAAINRNLFGTPSKAGADIGVTSTLKPVGGFPGFGTTGGSTSNSSTPVNVAKSSATSSTPGFNFGNTTGAATFKFGASSSSNPSTSFSFSGGSSTTKTATTTAEPSTTKPLLSATPKTAVTATSSGGGASSGFGGFKFSGGSATGGTGNLGGPDGSGEVKKSIVESSPMLLKALSVDDSDTEDHTRSEQKSAGSVAPISSNPAGGAAVTTSSQTNAGFNFSLSTSAGSQQKQTTTSQAQPSPVFGAAPGGTKGIMGGLFGAKPSPAAGGIFVQPTSTEGTTPPPSTKPGSLLGRMLSGEDHTEGTAPSTGGIFGQPESTSGKNAFVSTSTATTTVGGSLVGQTPSGTTISSASVTSSTVSSTGSILGQPTVTSVTPTSTTGSGTVFGQATTTTANVTASGGGSGVFGQPAASTATTTTSGSTGIFGQPTSTNSTATGIFSTPSSTTSTSIFGQPPNTNSSAFGSATVTTSSTSAAGMFGKPATQFGAGLGSQTTTSSGNTGGLFGQPPAQTSTSGVFGQQPAQTSSSGVFGQQPAQTSSSGVFGQQPAQTSSSGVFGQQPAQTSSSGVFGQQPAQTSSSGVFGQPAATTAGVFGTMPTSTAMFGGSTAPVFGSTKPATTSAPLFGSTVSSTTAAPAFGSSPGFGASKPAFGQSTFGQSSSPFGQPASGDSSSSGSSLLFSGLGGQPSTEKANTNVFGSAQTFGGPPASSTATLFGSQATSGFGSAGSATTSPKTSGLFSGGGFSGGGVGSTGFGVSQQNTGFGAAPSFGGSPAFGSGIGTTPTFGSSTAFGGGASFGGGATFGSPTGGTGTSGFAGFASSNSPTFGSLAQSDAPTFGSVGQSTAPGFGSMGQGGSQPTSGFGAAPGFGGSPSFGGSNTGFGNSGSNMGGNPAFTGYRS